MSVGCQLLSIHIMEQIQQEIIKKAYAAFNERDIDQVLSAMHPRVHWPNGWEGGYVIGHAAVRDYWTRQWKELNPRVEPTSFRESGNGKIEVLVHQLVKDIEGKILSDTMVKHIYTFDGNLITAMEIA